MNKPELMPVDVATLKPGDVVYREADVDELEGDDEAFNTAVIVIRRMGKTGWMFADFDFMPTLYRRIHSADGPPTYEKADDICTIHWFTDDSLPFYRTQAEAIRAGVAREREYIAGKANCCEIAERIAARLEAQS